MSQHIRYLEEEYQTTLFVYSNKHFTLTRSGEILRKYLLTMQNDEKNIKKEIRNSENVIETLSIGVTRTIGEYAIVDRLADFIKHHHEINLHLHYGNTAELLKLLEQGMIPMAIVEGNYPKERYGHKKYSTEDYIGICAASHEFKDTPHTLHNLKDCGISFMYKTAVKEELQTGVLKELVLDDFKLQHNFMIKIYIRQKCWFNL